MLRLDLPTALTIAGSDSGANAGIQADLLTFAANGVYGASAITCLTAQNPAGVSAIHAAPTDFVTAQIEQVSSYFSITAAKTGMLFNRAIIEAVADFFQYNPQILLVVDPVSVATSGHSLLQPDAVDSLKSRLLPLATIITPNLDEAELLLGRQVSTSTDMETAAVELARRFCSTVMIKGGHLRGDLLTDIASDPAGKLTRFTQTRILDIDTHGSGCTLSAAIAAYVARGRSPLDAIAAARAYLREAMEQPLRFKQGKFINHFPQ